MKKMFRINPKEKSLKVFLGLPGEDSNSLQVLSGAGSCSGSGLFIDWFNHPAVMKEEWTEVAVDVLPGNGAGFLSEEFLENIRSRIMDILQKSFGDQAFGDVDAGGGVRLFTRNSPVIICREIIRHLRACDSLSISPELVSALYV